MAVPRMTVYFANTGIEVCVFSFAWPTKFDVCLRVSMGAAGGGEAGGGRCCTVEEGEGAGGGVVERWGRVG